MKIVIVGAGEVGRYLSQLLSERGDDVTVIENNRACTEIRRIRSDQQVDPAASAAYGVHDQLVYCADLRDY